MNLIKYLKKMQMDEMKAPMDYYHLIWMLKDKKDKAMIRGIIMQERSHLKKLRILEKKINNIGGY